MTGMSPATSLQMAETAIARLCHDLSGSLGTVLNALELARTGDAALAEEAMKLSAEAAGEIAARLRLARMLWGRDGGARTSEVLALADGLPGRARIRLEAGALAETLLCTSSARLLLSLLMLAAESLHGPGSIVLGGDAARGLSIAIDGLRAAWPDDLADLLAAAGDPSDGLDVKNLPCRIAVLLAREAGYSLALMPSSGAAAGPPALRAAR